MLVKGFANSVGISPKDHGSICLNTLRQCYHSKPPQFTRLAKPYAMKLNWFHKRINICRVEVLKMNTKLQLGSRLKKIYRKSNYFFVKANHGLVALHQVCIIERKCWYYWNWKKKRVLDWSFCLQPLNIFSCTNDVENPLVLSLQETPIKIVSMIGWCEPCLYKFSTKVYINIKVYLTFKIERNPSS